MARHPTLFHCVLERTTGGSPERRVVEVWADWPGTALKLASQPEGGWTVVEVEPDFSTRDSH